MAQKPTGFPSRLVRAGGAVVFRRLQGQPGEPMGAKEFQVLLVHRPGYRDWSFPKGKAKLNEPLPVTAVREVEEETGVPIRLHLPLPTQRYRLSSGVIKEVHYWVGSVLEVGSLALVARSPVVQASRKEIDRAEWFFPAKAREKLTRRGDRRLLDKVVSIAAEPTGLETGAVVYLRHGEAISRKAWSRLSARENDGGGFGSAGSMNGVVAAISADVVSNVQGMAGAGNGSLTAFLNNAESASNQDKGKNSHNSAKAGESGEARRPLSRLGGVQAVDLVPLLSAFGVEQLCSSPWVRCLQTIWPYAAVILAKVGEIPALTETACEKNPGAARRISLNALRIAGQLGEVVALSLHRPTLPVLLQPVRENLASRKLVETLERPKFTLRPAEMFVVHVSKKSVLAIERQAPLTKLALGI